jgi:prolyl oligopeptidase
MYKSTREIELPPKTSQKLNYPDSPEIECKDILFGEVIEDPYRWLEDLKSDSVKEWFRKQSEFCDSVIGKIQNRDKLVEELKKLDDLKEVYYGRAQEINGRYFFTRRKKGEDCEKLYFRESKEGEDNLLFDPESYAPGKKHTISKWQPSHNGATVALGVTESGKEISSIRFVDVRSRNFLPDEIRASMFNWWVPEYDRRIIYSKFSSEDIHDINIYMDQKVMMHLIGTEEGTDKVLFSREKYPNLNIHPEETLDVWAPRYTNFIFAAKGTVDPKIEMFFAPKSQIGDDNIKWMQLFVLDDEIVRFTDPKFASHGDHIYVATSKSSPRFKVIRVSLKDPEIANAKVIYEAKDGFIKDFCSTKDYLVILENIHSVSTRIVKVAFADDKPEIVPLPFEAEIFIDPINDVSNKCTMFVTSWTNSTQRYEIDISKNEIAKSTFDVETRIPGLEDLTSENVEVKSHDGVLIPLSIVYNKKLFQKDGSNICLLEAYGAYGEIISQFLDKTLMPLYNRGLVYAFARVRGGGDKGEEWHRSGMKERKPNTWKDFIACAKFLVDNNYTSSERLAGSGTSAGGITVGLAMIEEPKLFKAIIPMVGAMNTLRMLDNSPSGLSNVPEYGSNSTEAGFKGLRAMDAVHNLSPGVAYPANYITTGFNDPRVISWVPAKYAAKLQKLDCSGNPMLLKVDYNTGHGGGETVTEMFNNLADMYAFILWQCGHPEFKQED